MKVFKQIKHFFTGHSYMVDDITNRYFTIKCNGCAKVIKIYDSNYCRLLERLGFDNNNGNNKGDI